MENSIFVEVIAPGRDELYEQVCYVTDPIYREFGKLVSMQILESIREVLDHLRNWAMRLDQEGRNRPAELNKW